MPRLIACSSCKAHVRTEDSACPHCGAPVHAEGGRFATTAIAALLGFGSVAVGCEKGGAPGPVEPEYGAPVVEPAPGGDDADGDSASDTPADPPPSSDPDNDPPAEPEYGAVMVDPPLQPDYGVADPSEL